MTINPAECQSPVALFYAGEEIDVQSFDPRLHCSEDRLKRMFANPPAVVEYFHDMVNTIIEMMLKEGIFGELAHHYGTMEYQ